MEFTYAASLSMHRSAFLILRSWRKVSPVSQIEVISSCLIS